MWRDRSAQSTCPRTSDGSLHLRRTWRAIAAAVHLHLNDTVSWTPIHCPRATPSRPAMRTCVRVPGFPALPGQTDRVTLGLSAGRSPPGASAGRVRSAPGARCRQPGTPRRRAGSVEISRTPPGRHQERARAALHAVEAGEQDSQRSAADAVSRITAEFAGAGSKMSSTTSWLRQMRATTRATGVRLADPAPSAPE